MYIIGNDNCSKQLWRSLGHTSNCSVLISLSTPNPKYNTLLNLDWMALSLNLHIINVHSFVCDQQQNESYNIFFPKHWYIIINKKSDLSWYVNSFEPTCMSWQQQQHKPWRWSTIPIKTSFKFNNFWCRLIITLFRYILIFNQNSYFVVLLQWLMFLINQNKLTSIMINQHFATVTTAKQEQIFSVSKGKTSSCIRHLPLALPKRLCNTTELKK